MFTIIGGDGKEYGPVSAEQMRSWVGDGRANLDSKAKKTGDEQWRRLGDFPEFNPSGTTQPPAEHPAPAATPINNSRQVIVDPKAYADDLIARAGQLDISGCLERSWELLKANFWPIVGATTGMLVIMILAGLVPVLGLFVGFLFTGIFLAGMYAFYLKKIRGQPAEFGDIFDGFKIAFVPLLLATLVTQLLTTAGLLLLILPGIYLAVAYNFAFMLIIDQRLEFWAAMEVSRRVITAQWWRMFGLLILGSIIALLGVVGLVIGMLVTIPIYYGALVYAYEDLCNPPKL
uniref:GYF domain-containing protein n=1 Tax=Cephaloticoccus sp. TaxID=1985742 RepID=UPI00404B475A